MALILLIKQERRERKMLYFSLERMTGIEPAYSAWEADVLPLNYICIYPRYYYSTAETRLSMDGRTKFIDGIRLTAPTAARILCLFAR